MHCETSPCFQPMFWRGRFKGRRGHFRAKQNNNRPCPLSLSHSLSCFLPHLRSNKSKSPIRGSHRHSPTLPLSLSRTKEKHLHTLNCARLFPHALKNMAHISANANADAAAAPILRPVHGDGITLVAYNPAGSVLGVVSAMCIGGRGGSFAG